MVGIHGLPSYSELLARPPVLDTIYHKKLFFSSKPMIQFTYTYLPYRNNKQHIYCYMEESRSPHKRFLIKKLIDLQP